MWAGGLTAIVVGALLMLSQTFTADPIQVLFVLGLVVFCAGVLVVADR